MGSLLGKWFKAPKHYRVLVLDDEPDFLEVMAVWLESRGYEPVLVSDGRVGIEKVRNNEADIVLVDYKMPGMGGGEVIKKIREFNTKIPAIVLTAYAYQDLVPKRKELGLINIFSKPKLYQELEQVLFEAVDQIEYPPGDEEQSDPPTGIPA